MLSNNGYQKNNKKEGTIRERRNSRHHAPQPRTGDVSTKDGNGLGEQRKGVSKIKRGLKKKGNNRTGGEQGRRGNRHFESKKKCSRREERRGLIQRQIEHELSFFFERESRKEEKSWSSREGKDRHLRWFQSKSKAKEKEKAKGAVVEYWQGKREAIFGGRTSSSKAEKGRSTGCRVKNSKAEHQRQQLCRNLGNFISLDHLKFLALTSKVRQFLKLLSLASTSV